MQSETSFCVTICHELQSWHSEVSDMITCSPSLSFMQQHEKSLLEWRNVWVIFLEGHPICPPVECFHLPPLPPGQPLFQQLDISQIKLKLVDGS